MCPIPTPTRYWIIASFLPVNFIPSPYCGIFIFFFSNLCIYFLHVCTWVCTRAYMSSAWIVVRGQFVGAIFSFHQVGSRDWTQVVKLGSKSSYPMNHLISPMVISFFVSFLFCFSFSVLFLSLSLFLFLSWKKQKRKKKRKEKKNKVTKNTLIHLKVWPVARYGGTHF